MSYTQAEYRGRNDDGSETTATWKAAANTGWTQNVGENFRVRARVTRATSVGDGVFAWQYSLNGTDWVNMPAAGTASVPVRFAASANLTDRAATTQQLGSGTFVAGRQFETNRSGGIGMTVDSETEIEGCFELVSGEIASGASLYFRAVEVTDFVVELDTTSQADRTVRIPFQDTMNVDIDWGDGSVDTGVTTADPEHTYADHGTYIVQVSGSAARLGNDTVHTRWKDTLVACHSFGSLGLTSLRSAFRDYPGTSLEVPKVLPSSVTNMAIMFDNCSDLTSLDVSGFDTAEVTNMAHMFRGCSGLTSLDVSGFDTAKVTNMHAMFYNCSDLTSLDVSGFDTAVVTDMGSLFYNCSGLTSLDVSGFDTANVLSMYAMFFGCSGLTSLDVSYFDTAKVTNMGLMFYNCSDLTSLDVSGFDTAKVTSMLAMFRGCSGASVNASTFNIAALTNATDMYLLSGHTTAHYDALLIAWGAQTVQSGVAFHAGAAEYTPGGAAEAGRDTLVGDPNLWVITDGGAVT